MNLRWHFDHGGALIAINTGADGALGDRLQSCALSHEAIAAHRKFLADPDE
jgi:acetoin utilization deacetylase AcuC-like enzyme